MLSIPMNKVKVGIAGAAGYTAGELIRILLGHPEAEIIFLQSESHHGERIGKVHADLIWSDLCFSEPDFGAIDLLFLCMGHGHSARYLATHLVPEGVKIIDLSNDFRLKGSANGFIYGLPELNREKIRTASRIANPGCFATAIELGLLPLAAAEYMPQELTVVGITGATGAGQRPSEETHFSQRSHNLSNYKVFSHQHLDEILETLSEEVQSFKPDMAFVPVRGCHSRGILADIVFRSAETRDWTAIYEAYYQGHPFVRITDEPLYLKQVVNTNFCFIRIEQSGDKVLVSVVLDNLLKGASGQAVQNMNLMTGREEGCGLWLKAVYF